MRDFFILKNTVNNSDDDNIKTPIVNSTYKLLVYHPCSLSLNNLTYFHGFNIHFMLKIPKALRLVFSPKLCTDPYIKCLVNIISI